MLRWESHNANEEGVGSAEGWALYSVWRNSSMARKPHFHSARPKLTTILNLSLEQSVVPTCLKEFTIVPVPKYNWKSIGSGAVGERGDRRMWGGQDSVE
eukprot:superscaffoldBa00000735_g6884